MNKKITKCDQRVTLKKFFMSLFEPKLTIVVKISNAPTKELLLNSELLSNFSFYSFLHLV